MAEGNGAAPTILGTKLAEARQYIAEHKLRSVGVLWASGIIGSLAYNFRKPGERMSVKLIHARLHAQALTLAALVASAGVEYYEHSSGSKAKKYEEHVQGKGSPEGKGLSAVPLPSQALGFTEGPAAGEGGKGKKSRQTGVKRPQGFWSCMNGGGQ